MTGFLITYETVTPESAEHGDAAERGYVQSGGWLHKLEDVDMTRDGAALTFDLRGALRVMGCCEDSGSWFTEADGRQDYRTGSETRYGLHPPRGITGASYSRVRRLLGAS